MTSRALKHQTVIEPTTAVKVTLIQAVAAAAIIGSGVLAYQKLAGTLDQHTVQIVRGEETQGKITSKVDNVQSAVADLNTKAVVAAHDQQNVIDKLTDLSNRISTLQTVSQPRHDR